MASERDVLALEPIADDPEVGRWLSAMQGARRDTVKELDDVTDEMLERTASTELNSIGTLLYHVALVEADWLIGEILGPEAAPAWPSELLPYGDRDPEERLTVVVGETLAQHLDRLARVRQFLMGYLQPMSGAEFHRVRAREDFDVAPDWVIHHLLQHEAEHRAHIAWVREALRPHAAPPL